MNILVTGGTGYIGSHTCVELLNNNHSVIIADNFINSKIETIDKIKQITNKDITFYQMGLAPFNRSLYLLEKFYEGY